MTEWPERRLLLIGASAGRRSLRISLATGAEVTLFFGRSEDNWAAIDEGIARVRPLSDPSMCRISIDSCCGQSCWFGDRIVYLAGAYLLIRRAAWDLNMTHTMIE